MPLCSLSIVKPTPIFMCGSLPVSFDSQNYEYLTHHTSLSSTLVERRTSFPYYKFLPPETNLYSTPSSDAHNLLLEGQGFFNSSSRQATNSKSNYFSKKSEDLSISGLALYGDKVDFIAPAEVLKQIFKAPYCQSGLSIQVHRVGRTIILNRSLDSGVGGFKKGKANGGGTLFSKFVQLSVLEPSMSSAEDTESDEEDVRRRTKYHHVFFASETGVVSISPPAIVDSQPSKIDGDASADSNGSSCPIFGQQASKDPFERQQEGEVPFNSHQGRERSERKIGFESGSHSPASDSGAAESVKDPKLEGFLRILFWQFEHLRMLLGSDLILFSNKDHAAVSLHLMSVTQMSNPLKWLDIWLDSVMASVPELAVCYHLNGVVQGYELLKTEDVLLVKGLSADGSTFFHPQVVQKNASSVLNFLQKNCSKDPGTYLLHKSSGEDAMQLFDLTPGGSYSPGDKHSLEEDGRKENPQALSLTMLLYRLANRLLLNPDEVSQQKSARFFSHCLDLLEEGHHPGVKASAHEHVARLLLEHFNQLSTTGKRLLLEAASTPTSVHPAPETASVSQPKINPSMPKSETQNPAGESMEIVVQDSAMATPADSVSQNIVAAKLQAVHHLSEAIRSLRVQRHMLLNGQQLLSQRGLPTSNPDSLNLCVCGEANCLPLTKIAEGQIHGDSKLLQLIALLGEAYLELAEAFKAEKQLGKSLRATELACLVCGSIKDSMELSTVGGVDAPCRLSFWGRLWCFVGDLYVEFHRQVEEGDLLKHQVQSEDVRLVTDVVKEVRRIRKKRGLSHDSCTSCREVNCSCLSDRCSSGSSASSSTESGPWMRRKSSGKGKKKVKNRQQLEVVSEEQWNEDQKSEECEQSHSQNSFIDKEGLPSFQDREEANPISTNQMLCFGRPITTDWESNLMAAAEHYSAAALSFAEQVSAIEGGNGSSGLHSVEVDRKWREVVKKRGWTFNELGRRYLMSGGIAKGEDALERAVEAFGEIEDVVNVVLVYCNLGHGRRAAAEALAQQYAAHRPTILSDSDLGLDKVKDLNLLPLQNPWRSLAVRASKLYKDSLDYYSSARKLLIKEAKSEKEQLDLWNEVLTQLAHTHLRMAMFSCNEFVIRAMAGEEDAEDSNGDMNRKESFNMALALYESMGAIRRQEAAYAHYQLACHHRDVTFLMVRKSRLSGSGRMEGLTWQQVRRYANLAEVHWEKSTSVYSADGHPDMFVSILIERADLILATMSSRVRVNHLEVAMDCLLESRLAWPDGACTPSLSSAMRIKVVGRVQKVLKAILVALNASIKQGVSADVSLFGRVKEMYALSLYSEEVDVKELYLLWTRK